jgi:TPR repeat protein
MVFLIRYRDCLSGFEVKGDVMRIAVMGIVALVFCGSTCFAGAFSMHSVSGAPTSIEDLVPAVSACQIYSGASQGPTAILIRRAESGDAFTQAIVGTMYERGSDPSGVIRRNPRTAVSWYRRSAAQDNPFGQSQLARVLREGIGVRRNYPEAMSLFRILAEKDDSYAQRMLGTMYNNGEGAARDPVIAANWFTKAAEKGDIIAQFELGRMYANGQGVEKDLVQAYKWLSVSHKQNYAAASQARTELARQMTEDQITQAQNLADSWVRK